MAWEEVKASAKVTVVGTLVLRVYRGQAVVLYLTEEQEKVNTKHFQSSQPV